MAPPPPATTKVSEFNQKDNHWYCTAGLASDITIGIDNVFFHLHKFPLMSRCGKIASILEESQNSQAEPFSAELVEFPGGPETFLIVAKFCYGVRVELTPKNIVKVYCAADFLEMTEEYGEDNLSVKSESYFHKTVLRNWKDCVLSLQSSEPVTPRAEKLQLVSKCLGALSMMACTDPSLFGWPMKMYGSLQSPGGSILWNGINTGARIRSSESDWWFEDISSLSLPLFERLVQTMKSRGMRPEHLARAIMYYARKYLPGLGRWQSGEVGKTRTVFSMTPAVVDQRVLLESIERLLPEKKGKSFCRFLLGLLRVSMILEISPECRESLEKRIGMQLDMASLDSLLIPNYSDADTLYNTDCVERIVTHFLSSERNISLFSPSSLDLEASPSSESLRKVAKLIDDYIAEIASDVNLKSEKLCSLAEALPDSSRSLHDGLYRAVDIYFKAHPWLSDSDKEKICNIIDYQKLSIDACTHASQNERLPLRVVLQVLFFEQLQLRSALAGCLNTFDTESVPAGQTTAATDMAGQIIQRDGWVTVVRENQALKVNLESMKSRVGELEQEFGKIKQEMQKVVKSHSSLSSPRLLARKIGCKLLQQPSDQQSDIIESVVRSPRASVELARPSRQSRHRKSVSLQ
ncbi:hypothetical protein C5167_045154 [Papaver somniferum]|uniref:NPH3 domain-containing protein n=1 Tax=Papaver somniferum TaxID=3469 RepID=A0A4Y7LCV1_PAPSO|nr:BTB/POZ domain-containing protein At3g44820-like [Papaver somniferum]RZC82368.1 hypothetical protein C5167_045154 [Papaver somniferum]